MSNTYSTRIDAVDAIITAIEAGGAVDDARAEYDIDAIADKVICGDFIEGYALGGSDSDDPYADHDAFWAVVMEHAR